MESQYTVEDNNDTKSLIEQYIKDHANDSKINTAQLGRLFNISRQRVWTILETLGETRHRRVPKAVKLCEKCPKEISRNATFCRSHSKGTETRIPGNYYTCRICKEVKILEEFAQNNQYASGYETRCLACRAKWQRDYHKTESGKTNHAQAGKTLMSKHPERQRAYYQVYKAVKDGTLLKQPCINCGSENSKAVHTDYNRPLDVMWMCALCRNRRTPKVSPYVPNPLEEHLRKFISDSTGFNRWHSKWIRLVKKHYEVATINEQILQDSLKDDISGLGKTYKDLIEKFLQNRTDEKFALIGISKPIDLDPLQ